MGLAEQIVFAEIDYDKIDKIRGWIYISLPAQKMMKKVWRF